MALNTTIQKGTEETCTTNSKGIRGINRTLYQVGWPMVKDNSSNGTDTTRVLTDSSLFLWVSTTASLAAAREVPYWYSAPKIANLGLGMCARVHYGHFGSTGACRGLLGQFLWPRTYMVLYCTCM